MTLPYPHARNDCTMCRECDADYHVTGDQWNRPETGYQTLLCQGCFGKWLLTPVYFQGGPGRHLPQPVTFTVEIPAARLADFGLAPREST